MSEAQLIADAVARSGAIADVVVGNGVLAKAGEMMGRHFQGGPAHVICDENTRAAGEALFGALTAAGVAVSTTVLPAAPRPKPTVELANALAADIGERVPVALGSGVINDVVKYAAFSLGRPYFCVATAASMDGYTSAGSPLSEGGFKKTIPTRAPLVILADLDVVAKAPAVMSGWGYGDLAGKVPAGGDWIVADALGVEAIDDVAWPLVQNNLAGWLSDPDGVKAGDPDAISALFAGLTLSGLAMEFHGSSRPASGADHQIAHLWEMESLTHEGERVSHGACVSVATMAVMRLYDWLIGQDLAGIDAGAILVSARTLDEKTAEMGARLPKELAKKAAAETAAKHASPDVHRTRLERVRANWPALRERLTTHLMRADALEALLRRAGAPARPHDIGIDQDRLVKTIKAARFIRSRYTILDLLEEVGLLERALGEALSLQET